MNQFDFISLATSKDKSRLSLSEVYRDKNALVATDGHRLHFVEKLPDATPGFPSGLDASFPDWQQVIPTESPSAVIEIPFDSDAIKRLKALLALAKIGDRQCSCKLIVEPKDSITFSVQYSGVKAELELPCGLKADPCVMGFNLSYLVDVFESAYKFSSVRKGQVKIQLHGPTNGARFDIPGLASAVVMPMRME